MSGKAGRVPSAPGSREPSREGVSAAVAASIPSRERRSPLDAMIDAVCACVKCGQKGRAGSCGCWVTLECPKCGKRRFAERDEFDPPNTARVQIQCPDCNAGDFDQPHYFDADGRELSWEDAPAVRDSGSHPKGENAEGG